MIVGRKQGRNEGNEGGTRAERGRAHKGRARSSSTTQEDWTLRRAAYDSVKARWSGRRSESDVERHGESASRPFASRPNAVTSRGTYSTFSFAALLAPMTLPLQRCIRNYGRIYASYGDDCSGSCRIRRLACRYFRVHPFCIQR